MTEIEVKGVPEGFKIVSISLESMEFSNVESRDYTANVRVKRVNPRRIILEETEFDNKPILNTDCYYEQRFTKDEVIIRIKNASKHWVEVKEEYK